MIEKVSNFKKEEYGLKVKSMQTSPRSKKFSNKLKMEFSDHRTKGLVKINSKAFATRICILTALFIMVDYIAVRIGIANTLELIFPLSLCSMITELHL